MEKENTTTVEFFEAVRKLMMCWPAMYSDTFCRSSPLGSDTAPEQEPVRFTVENSFTFPSTPISKMEPPQKEGEPHTMEVTFAGLTGPSGVLPDHYTSAVMSRLQEKDSALKDFLDLFHHRTLSLFYRAWEKYRLYISVERGDKYLDRLLLCFMGYGTEGLQNKLSIPDQDLIYYASLFMQHPRNASNLEMMLSDYLDLPVSIEQFQGCYLTLPDHKRPQLGTATAERNGREPIRFGHNFILGKRQWSNKHKFRVRIGPLTCEQFHNLLPDTEQFAALTQLTRVFVGPNLRFEVQLVLKAGEVPDWKLGGKYGGRLGWNTWLKNRPFKKDAEDVVFQETAYKTKIDFGFSGAGENM